MTGTLDVHAYQKPTGEELAAEVEIVGVAKYVTPFQVQLPAGTYILIANWMGQQQIKPAIIEESKTTTVNFYFEKMNPTLAYISIGLTFTSLIISILGLIITAKRK